MNIQSFPTLRGQLVEINGVYVLSSIWEACGLDFLSVGLSNVNLRVFKITESGRVLSYLARGFEKQ